MTDEVKQTVSKSAKALPMARGREDIHPDIRIAYNESEHTIPPEVEKRFKADGYVLRWIRYRIGEREDYSNISKKAKHGWTFVDVSEVPELGAATQLMNFGRYSGLVTIEDVALAKCKIKHVNELKKLKADRARQQLKAEEDKINRAGIDREHKTRISHGTKRPSFENDTNEESDT